MELYLQLGYGMMDHCKVLLQRWGGGTVILSPRDLDDGQIGRFSSEVVALNGKTVLDPQLYDPRATHHRLVEHDYWPEPYDTSVLLGGQAQTRLLSKLKALNDSASTEQYIVPSLYCERVTEDWLTVQEALISGANAAFGGKSRLATIALSAEALRFDEQIETLLLRSESWAVDGYYLVAEHPKDQYLIEDPLWLTNLMLLCSGLRLQNRQVIVGYCTHQMLALASTNVDAIASGTWLNVRCFPKEKFQDDEEGDRRKALWYYCPQSLSEYKIPFLDMAFRANQLNLLKAEGLMESEFANILFAGAPPSSTTFGEQSAFRHYLQCLHVQVAKSHRSTFRETLAEQELLLKTAEQFIKRLHSIGVRGQLRDFENIVDVNRAALSGLESSRGYVLDRQWSS